MRLAVVGTAGRREDGLKLTARHLEFMLLRVADEIAGQEKDTTLVSGGAAWADHVAVLTFMRPLARWKLGGEIDGLPANLVGGLTLYLPCPFIRERQVYQDDGSRDWVTNPGGTANFYHRRFSEKVFRYPDRTLGHIRDAINAGAEVAVGNGFKDRNSDVANVDRLIAFTFGPGGTPKDGGTADTWRKAKDLGAVCRHYTLVGI